MSDGKLDLAEVETQIVSLAQQHKGDLISFRGNLERVLMRMGYRSQAKTIKEQTKLIQSVGEMESAVLSLLRTRMDKTLAEDEFKVKKTGLQADTQENRLRRDSARQQRENLRNNTQRDDERKKLQCKQVLASYQIKLKAVEFDAYKDYPELREQLKNSSDKNIVEILEQRIEDGISPKYFKKLIERILKDQNKNQPKAQKKSEEYKDASKEVRADMRGQFELRQAIYDEFELMKKDIERRQDVGLINDARAKEELDAAKRMIEEKLRGL